MLRRVALLAAALFAAGLPAQEKFVEHVEVHIVNVDVVVTDRAGKTVTGLTRDDFEILENGKPQTITNFEEIRGNSSQPTIAAAPATASATPVAARPRRFLLFVDSHSLDPTVRTEVVASMEHFVDTKMGPNDEASVVGWNGTLNILAGFTRERATLHAALKKAGETGSVAALSTPLARVQKECVSDVEAMRAGRLTPRLAYDSCILAARDHTHDMTLVSRQLLGAMNVVLKTMEGFEGKKVLVLAGAQLPSRPGLETYQWANRLFQPYMGRGFDAPMAHPDETDVDQDRAIEAVAESANAYGVTMYIIGASVPHEATITSASPVPNEGTDFIFRGDTAFAFQSLAAATGGLATTRNGDFGPVFDAIARDLESYYSLAYKPAETLGRDARAIEVRTKNRAYTVRTKKSWTPKTPDEQFADRVIANIYSPGSESDFEVRIKTSTPRKESGNFVVPIEVSFSPNAITFLPVAEGLSGGFTFTVAVGNPFGGLSNVFRQPQSITIKKEEERGFRATPITFSATLTVRPGENLVSVGILDHVGRTAGFVRTKITAQ
ncbi:MAG TPA: VWA domain-containing protein [Thermoanaerobaculia bacterium]|jgi:VWFA-related protein|nr:VWA domain-containing protein [Thermoanaerobaculia bacterium]